MGSLSWLVLFVVSWLSLKATQGFYVMDVPPKTFLEGEAIDLKVNVLTSTRTQIPRDYYRLPFCQPEGGPKMDPENLGELLAAGWQQDPAYPLQCTAAGEGMARSMVDVTVGNSIGSCLSPKYDPTNTIGTDTKNHKAATMRTT
jgi:hypothetical protein